MYTNLAPMIVRQRLIIEGTPDHIVKAGEVDKYLIALSKLLKMHQLTKPMTRVNPKYGCHSYIYWEESGTHFYAWDKPFSFISVDVYTCKKFNVKKAVDFTKKFFRMNKAAWKSI